MGSNIKKCEFCGKEHNGTYGSGRFCCAECARKFSNRHIKHQKTKKSKCVDCGKEIDIWLNASSKTCRCRTCREKRTYYRNFKNDTTKLKRATTINDEFYVKCPICGQPKKQGSICSNKFCQKHNVQQFRSLIEYFGFDKNKLGTPKVEEEFLRVREMLYDMYHRRHMSSTDISKELGYPYPATLTCHIFKYLEIPAKSLSTVSIENHLNGKLNLGKDPKYKCEWHKTWDGNEVFLRSSYETDFANELDQKQIKYEVEGLRIKYFNNITQDYRCAIPDFYVPSTNTIIEIKSTWTLDIQEMKDKVKAYKEHGYNFKLILNHEDRTELVS